MLYPPFWIWWSCEISGKLSPSWLRLLHLLFSCPSGQWFSPTFYMTLYRRTVNKTSWSNPRQTRHFSSLIMSFRDIQRVWVFWVWGLSFRDLRFRDTMLEKPLVAVDEKLIFLGRDKKSVPRWWLSKENRRLREASSQTQIFISQSTDFRSSVFGLRSSVFGLRSSVFGLRSSVFGLRSSVFGFWSLVFGLRSSFLGVHFRHNGLFCIKIEFRTINWFLRLYPVTVEF